MFKKYAVTHECGVASGGTSVTSKTDKKKKEKKALYKCEKCDEQFVINDELVCHQFLVCEDEPQFICPICGKVCINSQRLSEHKRSHENHVYVCDECGHSTTSVS
jgi:rubrerythrin